MAIDPLLRTVPRGTVVAITIRVPGHNGGAPDGFAWTAPANLSPSAVRARIDGELLPKFFDQFLPAE
ncbi:MAG: hypothetical protein K2Y40_12665 [Reyranella sp.]|nr:hypothetical protein [Reyranella sp.]